MGESEKVEGLEFKWGKKRETGVEHKDVTFYESFTYDGSEYHLYDCVLVGDTSKTDSTELFVGKIIKIWEYNDQCEYPRRVELLWFFKPCELLFQLQGVQDVLSNELFLASGSGLGLSNENILETISGKCNVLCISKDVRNPQPSEEEIKLADFIFHRTYDVGTSQISEKMDDKIAGVDVRFIFNRTSCKKKASNVQKVATGILGTADSLKPNLLSTSGSVRQNESNVGDISAHRERDYGYNNAKDNERHRKLARRTSTVSEERSKKDNGRRGSEHDYSNPSGSRRNDVYGKKDQDHNVEKQLTKQKPRLTEEGFNKDSYCLDHMPLKQRKLLNSLAVSDGRAKESQKISLDGGKEIEPIRCPRDNVTREEVYSQKPRFTDKNQDPRIPRFSEGKETKPATEKGLSKRSSTDSKRSKNTEAKMLANADYRRDYQIFEVTQKPIAEESKWFRKLSWEEELKCAEGKGTLVLLHNLDPSYTSSEVEDIVFSALNEQCRARMIERTLVNIPHSGEALVIFETMDAANRAVRRLDEGCLLLSDGRVLVATKIDKVNPPVMPPFQFNGHIKPRTQKRQGTKNAVATSHCSQRNTIEFDMSMEWCLLLDRYDLTRKKIIERQLEEKKLRLVFNPKVA
ncbi:unnamed protein product [Cochlearia groenlandica]